MTRYTYLSSETSRPRNTRAVFLDRDGVINENRDSYVRSWDEFVFLPNVIRSIRRLAAHFTIVVVTNQSVIGQGLIDFLLSSRYTVKWPGRLRTAADALTLYSIAPILIGTVAPAGNLELPFSSKLLKN